METVTIDDGIAVNAPPLLGGMLGVEPTDDLEETLFGPDAFPEVMGPRVRAFTWKFVFKGTVFYCIALPKDVLMNAEKKMRGFERDAARDAQRARKLFDAAQLDAEKVAAEELALLAKAGVTAVQIAEREIEIEDAASEREREFEANQTVQESAYLDGMEAFLSDVIARSVRDWHDPRWTRRVPCNATNLNMALSAVSEKMQVAQIILEYSQTSVVASDFLVTSSTPVS